MIGTRIVVLCAIAVAGVRATFPPDFKFGAATAAYQIEGAWNETDKSANVWDDLTHRRRDAVVDGSNGDVSCDSYRLWSRDIEMAEELGLDYYRFSVAWSRLCPNGFCNTYSTSGAEYYSSLIDGLLAKGIEPVVTLYHWDLPQRLQNFGGWANPLIIDWFESYARTVFSLFADRVKTWITINEPMMICDVTYSGYLAPVLEDPQYGAYLCTKNVLLAHAKAWRAYDKEYKPKYQGQASLSNYLIWYEPRTPQDQDLVELALQHSAGRFSHAIYSKEGGWPPALEKLIEENSKKEGYPRSKLPAFTEEEKELVKGTYDFYGVNYYTSRVLRPANPGEEIGVFPILGSKELNVVLEANPEWKDTLTFWFKQNPKGLRNYLNWLTQQYGNITFLITENGFPTDGSLNDDDRVQYFKDHLEQIQLAIQEDGVDVKGYTAWSLMDNFEWRYGYMSKYGLYAVNFTDPQRTRTARASARFYANVIKTRSLEAEAKTSSMGTWLALALTFIVLTVAILGCKYINRKERERPNYDAVALSEDARKSPYRQ